MIQLFILKHNAYKQMRHSSILERKGAWEAGWGWERVALIKSLITRDRKRCAWGTVAKFELKMSADSMYVYVCEFVCVCVRKWLWLGDRVIQSVRMFVSACVF